MAPPPQDDASFSVSHSWLARNLPPRLVALFDRLSSFPPAPEHFALPTHWPLRTRMLIGAVGAVVCSTLLLLAFGLSVYTVAAPSSIDGNATNATALRNATC